MSRIFKSYRVLFELDLAHNDVKPENIVLSAGGEAKFIDFGFTKTITRTCSDRRCTPAYAAPEVHQGFSFDNSLSDMYSMGEVMCMLAFKEHSCSEQERALLTHSNASRVKLLNLRSKSLRANGRLGEKMLAAMLQLDPVERLNFAQMFSAEFVSDQIEEFKS